MSVNFGMISDIIHKHFDSDYIDIFRTKTEGAEREELYSNVSCHIAISTADNPDPNSIDTQPIITSLVIHMPTWVDIQNNDYIIAKKMSFEGEVLALYSGTVGYPAVSMARQSVNMNMETLQVTEPVTPVPPKEKSEIIINYLDIDSNEKIKSELIQTVEQGVTANIFPAIIDNYELKESILDGQIMPVGAITIENPKPEGHNIQFKYNKIEIISYFRPLVKGPYTKDNGTLAFGLHLYSKIPVLGISDGILKVANNKFQHDEIGFINIQEGLIIRTNLGNWFKVISNAQKIDDGYIFEYEPYEPTEEEQNAYVTHWYDS